MTWRDSDGTDDRGEDGRPGPACESCGDEMPSDEHLTCSKCVPDCALCSGASRELDDRGWCPECVATPLCESCDGVLYAGSRERWCRECRDSAREDAADADAEDKCLGM